MPIKAVCPECETTYQLADQQAGKNVRCKNCQTVFTVAGARSKPDTVTRRGAVRRRDDYEDDDAPDEPRRGPARSGGKKSSLPWLLGGALIGVGALIFLCGGVAAWYFWPNEKKERVTTEVIPPKGGFQPPPFQAPPNPPEANPPPPQADNNPPIQGKPVEPPPKAAEPAKPDEPKPAAETKPHAAASNNGQLSRDARDRVKRATVYLRVKMADGTMASGSGFFGCKEARNIILTNAHVVGMLSPESARPQSVEVVVNSGQPDEWKTTARVLGVDRVSDLAVLDIGTASQQVPEPLSVRSARDLQELDLVYIFGFPLGEQLGKEISINETKVTSMRHKGRPNERIQVGSGMNPGNSGGPLVDSNGLVVGVAVAGIPGYPINFAIPGDRVDNILNGRISDLIVQQPYYTGENKLAVPVIMEMIDPRNLIKEVGLEVWTGNTPPDAKSGNRAPDKAQPSPQAGDSQHVYFKLKYRAPEGREQIVLPDLPQGKVYWRRAKWITAKGETRWDAPKPIQLTSAPVTRRPANLVLHYTQGATRQLELSIDNTFKVSSDEDSDTFRIRTAATLVEKVASAGGGSTLLTLKYKFQPSRDLILPDGKSIPNPTLEQIKKDLPQMISSVVQLDRVGNIMLQSIDKRPLRQLDPKRRELMMEFHEMIQQGLETLAVSLPPNGSVKPLESWKAERQLPIDTPGKTLSGKFDVTFTYLGTRKRDGREEAVIGMDGSVHGKDDWVGGRAEGHIMVDLNTGQTLLAESTVKLQLKALLNRPGEPPRELRVLDTIKLRMQRKM